MFNELQIKQEYRSPQDNIIQDFYIPVLENAVSYRRSVGFFSSSALVEISKGICELAKKGGKIELVASPYISAEDEVAIRLGYENRAKIIENALLRGLKTESENFFEKERLNLLANLIEQGVLNVKIAFTENGSSVGIYHEKLGLVEDSGGNKIAFSGSMNESENAFTKNYETVDVFCSWKSEDEKRRVLQKEKAFAAIWGNYDEKLKVLHFPSIDKAILEKYKRGKSDFDLDRKEFGERKSEKLSSNLEVNEEKGKWNSDEKIFKVNLPSGLLLHPYQKRAVEEWERRNFVGIYDMATGTGKTLTALASLTRIYHKLKGNICVVILCPYIHLVLQWIEDVEKFGIRPIVAFGSSPQKDWKNKLRDSVIKRNFSDGERGFFCLVSSIATFKREFVQGEISKIRKPIFLIADEAHNLGSAASLKYLNREKFLYRLGLSATLERHFDDAGTKGLLNFFGEKCIEYGLKEAIDEGYLTPYRYYPIVTTLNLKEKEKYLDLTESIKNEVRCDEFGDKTLSEKGKKLCIERARVVAGSASKTEALLRMIKPYAKNFNILIYCGATRFSEDGEDADQDELAVRQIDGIVKKLYDEYEMKISKFIAEKTSDEREIIIENFKRKRIQVITAIKCLDEGVNIPSIKTAFILASSTNPKEYIQRRGRVLRLSEGKNFAEIYDFVCLPDDIPTLGNKSVGELDSFKSLAVKEILRIREFSRLSMNSDDGENLAFKLESLFNLNENNLQQEEDDEF